MQTKPIYAKLANVQPLALDSLEAVNDNYVNITHTGDWTSPDNSTGTGTTTSTSNATATYMFEADGISLYGMIGDQGSYNVVRRNAPHLSVSY